MTNAKRPRHYRMTRRADAVEGTRARIVEAARELHADRGIVTTSYEAIAERAEVGTATVYRHFPTLEALIPACAADIVVLRPATREYANVLFRGLDTAEARVRLLVEGTCDCYERDGAWLRGARREDRLHPSLAALERLALDNLVFLVHVALAGTRASREAERTVVALIDYPFWHSLQLAGFTRAQAKRRVLALVQHELDRTETRRGGGE